ncbi:UNVERIFIED_CONTAM: hypothetical protein FKN15_046998 [Acipenser sinensis]
MGHFTFFLNSALKGWFLKLKRLTIIEWFKVSPVSFVQIVEVLYNISHRVPP